jgi:hypothetical protein
MLLSVQAQTRDFVAVTTNPDPPTPTERTPTPDLPKTKRGKSKKKRAPKAKPRPRVSAAAKKRKRVEAEEDAEMSDTWSDLDKGVEQIEGGEEDDVAPMPSGTAPTRRSARQKNISPIPDIDVDMNQDDTVGSPAPQDPSIVIVKSEPDDAPALANLLPIPAEDESTPVLRSQSPKPPSDHINVDEGEEEKPKQELHLTYAGYVIPSRCLCVIAEPWPALPTPAQLASQFTKQRRPKPTSPPPVVNSRPLFRADSDDEEDRPAPSPAPEFDSDDEEGRLRMFSQMINKVGENRSGVAARGGMDEFEDDALYGDADEDGRGV